MIRRLRMAMGLVLFAYVTTHLVNHSLGIVSVAATEAMLKWVRPVWTSIPGTVAIYGAFLIHLVLAFFAVAAAHAEAAAALRLHSRRALDSRATRTLCHGRIEGGIYGCL
jgi:hypothetical protein